MESGYYWAKFIDGDWEIVEVWGEHFVSLFGSSGSRRITDFVFGDRILQKVV